MIHVIYHKSDYDGIMCREIASLANVANLIGYDYGDPVPQVADYDQVIMLDISIPELMGHKNLVWIDHHATAIAKWDKPEIDGLRIDGVAACRLAWQYFFRQRDARRFDKSEYVNRNVSEPTAVRLAGEWDVWDKRDPAAELFNYGLMASEPVDFRRLLTDHWTYSADVGEVYLQGILKAGAAAKGYMDNLNACIVKERSFTTTWEGQTFLCLNTAKCNSLTFTAAIKPEHTALLGFYFDGKVWTTSLYGAPGHPDVDLAAIAIEYGGGGHKQACGFKTISLPPYLNRLTTHK